MFVQKIEKISAASQVLLLFGLGLWIGYRGTVFSAPNDRGILLPAVMAVGAGLTVIGVSCYIGAILLSKHTKSSD